ncbi:MAG: class I SAM-dependent methyltransferase [Vicinamibacterales bacterium]
MDVGGGDSRLVDHLVARGLSCVTVLDISPAALTRAQARLGPAGAHVTWMEADVTADWSVPTVDMWHDRAVFHFLTTAEDRSRYLAHLRETLKPDGTAILATFALDGPERCSGLLVARYSPERLAAALGDEFQLIDAIPHNHHTPSGTVQPFIYTRFQRIS